MAGWRDTASAVTEGKPLPPPELTRAGRVWLRRVRLGDAAAIFETYAGDPVATRYLSWPTRQRVAEVAAWLAPKVSGWDGGSEYRWVIADHPDGDGFGTVSLRRSPAGFDLGYALATSRAGNGVATDVVSRVLALCGDLPLPPVARVTARTDPDNLASVRVLDKCGFTFDRCEPASAVRPGLGSDRRDTLVFTVDVSSRSAAGTKPSPLPSSTREPGRPDR